MKKQNNKRLQIAYACNDKMFDGLYLSILSIIKRTKNPIDFYLFTADLTELNKKYVPLTLTHKKDIDELIYKYNKKSSFKVMDCKKFYYLRSKNNLPNTRHWPPYTTFRLLFDMFKELKGKILYIDVDTMISGDISKAFEVDMTKLELCVTHDIIDWDKRLKGKYFNAGVILMNLDVIRKTNYLKKAFQYLLEYNPKMCDQDALNLTCKYIKFREDDRFNRILKSRLDNTIVKHFAGPCVKPWDKKFERKYIKLNYQIWKDDIDEWKTMKQKLVK